jgi:hypothetical protein
MNLARVGSRIYIIQQFCRQRIVDIQFVLCFAIIVLLAQCFVCLSKTCKHSEHCDDSTERTFDKLFPAVLRHGTNNGML